MIFIVQNILKVFFISVIDELWECRPITSVWAGSYVALNKSVNPLPIICCNFVLMFHAWFVCYCYVLSFYGSSSSESNERNRNEAVPTNLTSDWSSACIRAVFDCEWLAWFCCCCCAVAWQRLVLDATDSHCSCEPLKFLQISQSTSST